MSFEAQLGELVAHAEKAGQEKLQSSLDGYVGLVVDALGDDWSKFDKSELTADAEEAGDAAIWLDAVACVKRGLVGEGKAVFADIELDGTQTAGDVAASVDRLFTEGVLPAKGLIYVAWNQNPEDYQLVGRASSRKKLKFTGKEPLAQAIDEADTLSFIVPTPTGEKTDLSALASSLIHLIRAKTDQDPTFNDNVDPDMPDSEAWDRIAALSDLLENAGVHLHNRAKLGED